MGQVLFLVEIIKAGRFNQQQKRLAIASERDNNTAVLKGHIRRTEADLAKERAEAERAKADLAQAQEEIRRLREIVASYAGQ